MMLLSFEVNKSLSLVVTVLRHFFDAVTGVTCLSRLRDALQEKGADASTQCARFHLRSIDVAYVGTAIRHSCTVPQTKESGAIRCFSTPA